MINIKIPKNPRRALEILKENGFEGYVVGGCVRDSLLCKVPKDWDICTPAKPEELIKSFKDYKVIETGIKYGTVTVIIDKESIELTTYRVDGEYKDNRRPDKVEFKQDLREDLSRRDFTINGMAYNYENGLQDFFSGRTDIEDRLVRSIGKADDRFKEDALRILRALRFSSELDFQIEEETAKSIHKNKDLILNVAVERINVELAKILCGRNAKEVLAEYRDVLSVFIPEIKEMFDFEQNNPHHYLNVWDHTLEAIKNSEIDKNLRLIMFFHDIGKPGSYSEDESGIGHFYGHSNKSANMAKIILSRLKFDGETTSMVSRLISYHDAHIIPENKHVKKWLNKLGEKELRLLLKVKEGDAMAQHTDFREEKLEQLSCVSKLIDEIIEEDQCFSIKDLAVNGRDLMEIGIENGKGIGFALNRLLDMVVEGEIENEKAALLNKAQDPSVE